ncbi:DUF4374 domain-containing protein [Neotamlana laminarinivorans]|uniref:DUF4374 domain-containing protein n=1 Tax=Neotamlana laminarinivorans TaxID=2883124 RepID=A0A9X1I2I7_9FLAO|nr:DUF4374 domain-containing protein [Tamlana laminarinivorans]MCB4800016.1 DUF4374 domain-containing protein [Tamlana laminarinivorans]
MKTPIKYLKFAVIIAALNVVACSSDDNSGGSDDDDDTTVTSTYVIAASSSENDYIVSGDDISASAVFDATSVDAVQSPGDRIWSFYQDQVLYGFLYNQQDAGTTASYILNEDGTITKRNELALDVSTHIKEEVGDYLILGYSDRLSDTSTDQLGYFHKVDPTTDVSTEFTIVTDDLLEEGEAAYFTDLAYYEGYIIAGARSINSSGFTSDYYNNTYVVVFNDDFTLNQVIKDEGRTGFVAGQKYSQGDTGLEVVDNGDLYVFSSGQTSYADQDLVTVPSGILKINQGDFAFDDDYFFNITEASGGYNLFRTYYMGGSTFILAMYPGTNADATFGIDADRFAVVDVEAETFTWVTNFPEDALPNWEFRTPYADVDNGRLLITAVPTEGENYLYEIDAATATATQLSSIEAESVKIIGKLSVTE